MKRHVLFLKDCYGSVTVMTVVMMFVFVGLLAFVIDLAHVKTVKTELSNAGDACALRGARAFFPDDIIITGNFDVDPNLDNARTQAYNTISDNKSDNTGFQLGDVPLGDIQVGIWHFVNRTLMAWEWPPPSSMWGQFIGPGVSLPTRRTDSISLGPVGMTLANIFGVSEIHVHANATAALSPLGEVDDDTWDDNGQPPPLQIGDQYAFPGNNLTLHPDNTDAGGWHSYYGLGNPNKPLLEDLIWRQTKNGADVEIPTIDMSVPAQSAIERLNGVVSALFQNPQQNDRSILAKWLQMTGTTVDEVGNITSGPTDVWQVTLPVTSSDGPYVGTAEVLGFVKCTIDRVYPPDYPDVSKKMTIDLSISDMRWVQPGGGGGRYYGILTLEPKLVN
jgi:hypothetical protein